MAYYYDNLKLDKGMYRETGRSFSQVLEREDPSERYKGTSLEGLDAFQRQLKRFDIKVNGYYPGPCASLWDHRGARGEPARCFPVFRSYGKQRVVGGV